MCNVSNRYHVTACDPLMMIRLVVIVDGEGKGEKIGLPERYFMLLANAVIRIGESFI